MSNKPHFSRFLGAHPRRLHFAAHSHHPWPDVSFEAQQRAWLDAAEWVDAKWEHVFGTLLPSLQQQIAERLRLPDPATLAFAPSTHELFVRVVSALERRPLRVLTTDGEFHSFARQVARWEEAGQCVATRVPVEPFADFPARFAAAAARGGHELVFFSQVFFNCGYVVEDLAALVRAVPAVDTLVVIDGYHGFMALPTDLSAIAGRAFYLGGGYKYAMAGEGACYLHAPPGYAPRPVDTGWFAGFGRLAAAQDGSVPYPADGTRFFGATLDPTPLYRFDAVLRWAAAQGHTPERIHAHVAALQRQFLEGLARSPVAALGDAELLPPADLPRGNFLCLRTPQAGAVHQALLAREVVTDFRHDRLRIGFGLYHDAADVDALLERLATLAAG